MAQLARSPAQTDPVEAGRSCGRFRAYRGLGFRGLGFIGV